METSIVLLLSMAKNQYIVYVAQDSLLTGKDSFHLPLKMLRGTRDPKWQSIEIVSSKGSDKRSELS